MYYRHGHRCLTPHFVVKIALTYKRAFPILSPIKGGFLSKSKEHIKEFHDHSLIRTCFIHLAKAETGIEIFSPVSNGCSESIFRSFTII